jgi:biopolymer transport protein ExbB
MQWGLAAALVVGVGVLAAWAQEAAPAVAAAAAPLAPKKKTLLDVYLIGGWAMHPLLLCSLGVVGITVLLLRIMNRNTLMPPLTVASIKEASRNGDVEKVAELATATTCLFTTSLASGLRQYDGNDPAGSKNKMEAAIAETMGRQESQYTFWLNFLSLITAVAPMFGLLGTVSGMIGAFDKIGMGGMGKPELLAANIGEAMITTAAGLLVAIPAMFAYFLLRNFLNKLLVEAEDHLTVVLEDLTRAPETVEE